MHILPGFVLEDELKKQVSFIWHAEPDGAEWHIQRASETDINIKII